MNTAKILVFSAAVIAASVTVASSQNFNATTPRSNDSSIQLLQNETNDYLGIMGTVALNDSGRVSLINGSDWDYADAVTACRELGFKGVASFTSSPTKWKDVLMDANTKQMTITTSIDCSGYEFTVTDCALGTTVDPLNFTHSAGSAGELSAEMKVATLSCTGFETVRLVGGTDRSQGTVEVFFNESWGTVCHDEWGMEDANTVCKQLGYPGALTAMGSSAFGEELSNMPIWIDDANCSNNDTILSLCNKSPWGVHNCRHTQDAGVVCAAVQGGSPNSSKKNDRRDIARKIEISVCITIGVLAIVGVIIAAIFCEVYWTRRRKHDNREEPINNKIHLEGVPFVAFETD